MLIRLFGKLLNIAILVLILGGLYYYREPLLQLAQNNFQIGKACTKPLTYSIGTFDEKFNLTKEEFLKEIESAEKLWETPLGLNLYEYEESGGQITVNLIYDHRQEATDELKKLGILIDNDQASYDAIKERHTELLEKHEQLKRSIEQKTNAFESEKSMYEAEVRYYNARGGAPEAKYNELNTLKKMLDQKIAEINSLVQEINSLVKEINTNVSLLNQLAKNLNLKVKDYNTIGSSAGSEFREGEYIQDGFTRSIQVYQFSNKNQLMRVMAHELGHAVGLDHLDNPQAIMYYLNEGSNDSATGDDIDAMKLLCEI